MTTARDAALEQLYRTFGPEVLAYCIRRTSREEAKDATSEVFLVAVRRLDDVPDGAEALPWLYGVAANVLRNRQRSGRRRNRLVTKLAGVTDATTSGPEPIVVVRDEHRELVEALATLPEKEQEVLRLVEWEGLSRDQVADMMSVSRAAIDKRFSRAYGRLANALGVPRPDVRTAPVPVEEGGEA